MHFAPFRHRLSEALPGTPDTMASTICRRPRTAIAAGRRAVLLLCTALTASMTGLAGSELSVIHRAYAGGGADQQPAQGAAAANPQLADGTIKGQYGDWQHVCKPPPPGAKNEACALVQSVTAEDRKNVGLTIYFQKFSNGVKVLRVFAPLGILLPPGIGLKVDGVDIGHAPFLRCQTFACYAQVTVEDKLLEQLQTGKTAIFIIFQTEEAGIGIPISLAGFGQALAALQ
jgi:invasion protein IalB